VLTSGPAGTNNILYIIYILYIIIYNYIYIQCLGGYINEYMNRTNVSTSVNDSQWGYNPFPVILLNTPRNHWFGIKTHIWNPFRSSILGGWDYLYTYVYIYMYKYRYIYIYLLVIQNKGVSYQTTPKHGGSTGHCFNALLNVRKALFWMDESTIKIEPRRAPGFLGGFSVARRSTERSNLSKDLKRQNLSGLEWF